MYGRNIAALRKCFLSCYLIYNSLGSDLNDEISMSAMVVYLGVSFWLSAVVAILHVKSRGRLGRVERATDRVGIRLENPSMRLRPDQDSGSRYPNVLTKTPASQDNWLPFLKVKTFFQASVVLLLFVGVFFFYP